MTKSFGNKAGYERHKARKRKMDEDQAKALALQTLAIEVATQFLNLVSDLIAGRKLIRVRTMPGLDKAIVIE